MKDKKLILAALLLPVTVLFSGAALAVSRKPVAETNGAAPAAQAVEAETYVGIPVEIELSATDADSDVVLYQLTEQPRLGTAAINGSMMTYTPGQKAGKDKFAYTAVDANGNTADPAPVTVQVMKNRSKLTYADMEGNPAHYAAIQLAEKGVMTGESISGCYFFHPAQTVTRSEFIAMLAAAADLPVTETVQTDFADDSGLSDWARPFVSTAAASGLVSGYQTAAGVVEIRGQNPVTLAEASVMIDHLLASRLDGAQYTAAQEMAGEMGWAQRAVGSLERLEILPPLTGLQAEDAPLTRQSACEMLCRAMALLE